MSRTIQVRGVDERTYGVLRSRAAAEHLSLTAYLQRELERMTARPTMAEWLDGVADARSGPAGARAAAEETTAALHALRDAEDPRRSA